MHSENIEELAKALVKAQQKVGVAVKDKANPFFKSSYADLESVWNACHEALNNSGISVTQTPDITDDGKAVLVTQLTHTSGQYINGRAPLNPAKPNDPQAMGSAITYMRRYALAAMVGVMQSDDDGNAASATSGKSNVATPRKKSVKQMLLEEVRAWTGISDRDDLASAVKQSIVAAEVKANGNISEEDAAIVLSWVEEQRRERIDFTAAITPKEEIAI